MLINLAYGKTGLKLNVPEDWKVTVLEPAYKPGLKFAEAALSEALRNPIGSPPLSSLVKSTDRVGIVISDITRPVPTRTILQAVLAELDHVAVKNILLFNALGTHRCNSVDELRQMAGVDVVERYRIIQNDAFDPGTQTCVGNSTFDHEIWLNRELVECDVKILTGFIEPHFFAGFSGGGKSIMPGMAGLRTILGNHGARMIAHPNAAWGITAGNPIWEEIQQAARFLDRIFLVNVSLNREKQITGVFAGDLDEAHRRGCEVVRQDAMVRVDHPFDILITTNSGYPLDLNLYQAVKGISAAAQVVRQDGAILIASECKEGIPEHGQYASLLGMAKSPRELLSLILEPGFNEQDQWQVQIQAQIQLRADIFVYSDVLSDRQIHHAMMTPCRDIVETVNQLLEKYGKNARIGILPEGPQTIPYLQPAT